MVLDDLNGFALYELFQVFYKLVFVQGRGQIEIDLSVLVNVLKMDRFVVVVHGKNGRMKILKMFG